MQLRLRPEVWYDINVCADFGANTYTVAERLSKTSRIRRSGFYSQTYSNILPNPLFRVVCSPTHQTHAIERIEANR